MRSSMNRSKIISSVEGFEAVPNLGSTVGNRRIPKGDQLNAEHAKTAKKMTRVSKKKKLEEHDTESILSSSQWKNYGHFF